MSSRGELVLLCAAFAALAVPGCSSEDTPPPSVPAPQSSEIVIGVTDALTGESSGLGLAVRDSLLVAERTINSSGKVLGKNVRFRVMDDGSSRQRAVSNVRTLLDEKVVAILGPLTSEQAIASQEITYERQIVQLSATATSTLLTHAQPSRDRYFFRTVPSDELQGVALVRLAYTGVTPLDPLNPNPVGGACRSLAIVNGDDAYGNSLASVVHRRFLEMQGGVIALEERVPTVAESDYKALAGRVVTARPDCLVLLVYSSVATIFLRDLDVAKRADVGNAAHWAKFYTVGSDGLYEPQLIPKGRKDPADPRSENVTEGMIGVAPDSNPDSPEYLAFRNLYQAVFPGRVPEPSAAHQFDAALLIALAIEKAGAKADGVKIRDALVDVSRGGQAFGPAQYTEAIAALRNGRDIDYKGASGACDFDDTGDVIGGYAVWKVVRLDDGTVDLRVVARLKADALD